MSAPRVAHIATIDLSLRFLLLPQLRALRDAGLDVTTISAPGPWIPDLEAEGIRHIPWPHATRAWDPRSDAIAFRELLGILRRERFDLVHTHNPKPGLMGRVAARVAGVPHVINTVHGLYATPEDRLRRRAPVMAAEWIGARCSDLELYQSAEDLAWARKLHVAAPRRSLLLGNGVDVSRFSPRRDRTRAVDLRAELGVGPDEIVIGTVGRMVLEKGYDEFFRAARMVRTQVPDARFLAVGQSDPDKPDAVTAQRIELAADDVIFTGWREDVADLMAVMDIFVLPSWREGLPRSATEAAAAGLPLVLTDIRGCREVVRDGVEGFLVPVRDPVALAGAIVRLSEDADLRRTMGAAARRRAEETFDERRVVAAVVDVTRRMVDGRDRGEVDAEVRIRPARVEDAADMARLHRESMPTAFLPALGDRFLRRLYRAATLDREAVTMVAAAGDRVVGFAAAVPSVRAFFRRFAMRDGVVAGLAAAPRVMRRGVYRRAIETARYPSDLDALPQAELLSIAVAGPYRSRGVGAGLVAAVARPLARRGVREFKVVVGADNVDANRFYERMAVRPAQRIAVHDGVESNVWVLACPS